MQNFVVLLDSLVDARKRCCTDVDSKMAMNEALAIAERAIALIEDWCYTEQISDNDKETISLLESLARNTIFEFSNTSNNFELLSSSSSSSTLSNSLQELVETVNSDYQQQQQQQILSGLYRIQGKSSFSSFATNSDGRSKLARSSSSFSSASMSSVAANGVIMPAQRPTKTLSDGIEHDFTRAQSNEFDESLHIGANKIVSDSIDPSNTNKDTTHKTLNTTTTTTTAATNNEECYDDDAMMCFTQIPVPQFPTANTDEEAESIIMNTLETRPSVAVCEALVKQVLVDRVLALSGDMSPSRSLCESLFAVYDAYPSVVMDVVLGPMIKKGFSNAQASILNKFTVHAKLNPGVVKWLAESLCTSPSGASELAIGLFMPFVKLPEWSQLGPSELYAVSKWLQQIEPTLRKNTKFSSLLLALLKKHSNTGVSDTQASSQGKRGSYSQGNEEYMSILKELAKKNGSIMKRSLAQFCN